MKIEIKKFDNTEILFFFLFVPFLKTDYMRRLFWIDNLFDAWKAASFAIIILILVLSKISISKTFISIAIMELYLVIDTIYHKGAIWDSILTGMTSIGLCLLYEIYIEWGYTDILIQIGCICFEVLIYINLATIIIFPNGLYQGNTNYKNWFLGYYNAQIQYFLPAILMSILSARKTGAKLRPILLIVAVTITSALTWSGGNIATLALGAVLFIFKDKLKGLVYYIGWISQIMFYFFVVINKNIEKLRWIIGGLLGKWNSLIGRMKLWDVELSRQKEYLFFGNGIEDHISRINSYFGYSWAIHAHNLILEIIHMGGVLCLVIFAIIVLRSGNALCVSGDSYTAKVTAIIITMWAFRCLVDPYLSPCLIALFIFAAKSAEIESIYANNEIDVVG